MTPKLTVNHLNKFLYAFKFLKYPILFESPYIYLRVMASLSVDEMGSLTLDLFLVPQTDETMAKIGFMSFMFTIIT